MTKDFFKGKIRRNEFGGHRRTIFRASFFPSFLAHLEREYEKNGKGRERKEGGEVGQREEKIETGIRG